MDPRLSIINERLKNIKRIIAVGGGKGGIGKSLIASTLALVLADKKQKVGLLDLDFYGPSCHVILGIKEGKPKEEKGILPPEVYKIKFMSISYYAKDNPLAIRGIDVSNSIIEILAITKWDSLDFLIVDMPPGIGDATLDTIRLLKKAEFLMVTTSSKVVLETVKRMLKLLKECKVPIIGVIENMKLRDSNLVEKEIKPFDVRFLGTIKFEKEIEDYLGSKNKILTSKFAHAIIEISNYL